MRSPERAACVARHGGTGRTRTGNLLDAIEALSSLSYGPFRGSNDAVVRGPGGATGNRTPIPAMRMQRSPVELSPQSKDGRPRRNRTLSPGVGIPAGHHDSTACARAARPLEVASGCSQRPVGESNPSQSRDNGPATPVASRSIGIRNSQRVCVGVLGRSRTRVCRFRRPAPIRSATRTRGVVSSELALAAPRTGIEPSLHSMDSGAATPVASRGISSLFVRRRTRHRRPRQESNLRRPA